MHKHASLLVAGIAVALALLAAPAVPAFAEGESPRAVVQSGEVDTCKWELDDQGTLVISPLEGDTGELWMTEGWEDSLPDEAVSLRFEGHVVVRQDGALGFGWFDGLSGLETIDVSNLDTGKTTSFYRAFSGCERLRTIEGLSGLDTSSVTSMISMFEGCSSLESVDMSGLDASKVRSIVGIFEGCSSLASVDFSNLDVSCIATMAQLFDGCSLLTFVDFTGIDTSALKSMASMFRDCSSLESVDLSDFDTSSVESMDRLFTNCSSLESVDLSGLDTSSVTSMISMFEGCSSLEYIDLSGLDTSRVFTMAAMFRGCSSLKSVNFSGFDTSNADSMHSMFNGCSSLESLDLSGFETSGLAGTGEMFSGCSSLKLIDLSSFDTSSVRDAEGMFSDCPSLECVVVGEGYTLDFPPSFTGYWASSTGVVYVPEDVPKGVADTYTAYYRKVEKPCGPAEPLPYTGSEQVGVPEGEGYTLSGTWKATEPGSYEAVATLEEGYAWSDGTTVPATIAWSIAEPEGPEPGEPDVPNPDDSDDDGRGEDSGGQPGEWQGNGVSADEGKDGKGSGVKADEAPDESIPATGDPASGVATIAASGTLMAGTGLLFRRRGRR